MKLAKAPGKRNADLAESCELVKAAELERSGMNVLPDTNFWIALTLDSHPGHALATAWYAKAPTWPRQLDVLPYTELSFLRMTTQESTMLGDSAGSPSITATPRASWHRFRPIRWSG